MTHPPALHWTTRKLIVLIATAALALSAVHPSPAGLYGSAGARRFGACAITYGRPGIPAYRLGCWWATPDDDRFTGAELVAGHLALRSGGTLIGAF